MAYIHVEDFRGGQDRRRMSISGVPGTLYDCINGHVTRGGEVEKRKAFSSKYTLPAGTFGMASTAAGGIHVFGSATDPGVPSGVTYQRLQHPDGVAMSDVLRAEVFDGKLYVIAKFADGTIMHFYDGAVVTDWNDGIVRDSMTDTAGIAEHLKGLIDASDDYTATRSGSVITITGAAGVDYTVSSEALNGDGNATDDQAIATATTQETTPPSGVLLAGATGTSIGNMTNAGGLAGAFNDTTSQAAATSAQGTAATDGYVGKTWSTEKKIYSVDVYPSTDRGFLDNNNSQVTLTLYGKTGAAPSSPTDGTLLGSITFDDAFTGGDTRTINSSDRDTAWKHTWVTLTTPDTGAVPTIAELDIYEAQAGAPKIVTATISGTFEAGDHFGITLNDVDFGATGRPSYKGEWVLTYKSKLYSTAASIVYFCGINDPTDWHEDSIGGGFINMANHAAGSEELTALGKYNGYLAVFSRNTIQVWNAESDDDNNVLLHPIEDTGTRAPGSVLALGNIDTFYLDETGIRSLRARDSSGAPIVNDVGVAIDEYLLAYLDTLTDAQIEAAVAALEPRDGRYVLAVGNRVFVFTYFRGAKISAWSTYEPGISITEFTTYQKRLYARAGDVIYLYGGNDNATYDTSKVTLTTNFLSAGKAGHMKAITGFDLLCEGAWEVRILTDPRDHSKYIKVGTITDSTPMRNRIPAAHETSHFAVQLIHEAAGAAKVSSFIVHFDLKEAG